jgi:nitroreductase
MDEASMRDEMTDVFEVIRRRRSVRRFADIDVPELDLERILDAARYAPSSGNQQPWKFLVSRDRSRRDGLRKLAVERTLSLYREKLSMSDEELDERRGSIAEYVEGLLSAPVHVVVLTDNESEYASYNHHDGPLAAANLMLAARALGYGTLYITDGIPESVIREVFGIPDRYTFVCMTPIGVPETWPTEGTRNDLGSFLVRETFA